MNENKTNINCDKTIYRKFLEIIENTHFFTQRFFVFIVKLYKFNIKMQI